MRIAQFSFTAAAILFALFAAPAALLAQAPPCTNCEIRVPATTLLAGAQGQDIEIRATNDIVLYGYSIGLQVDTTKLEIVDVVRTGTATASADFFEGGVSADGARAGFGIVYDLGGDFSTKRLPPGNDALLLIVKADVVAQTDTSSAITFTEVSIPTISQQPIKTVMTNQDGKSVAPALDSGLLTIETRAPRILGIAPNTGLAGAVFRITGEFLDEPGLAVTVCGAAAAATVIGPGTIDVTAPACGSTGCVEVEVCTDRGCDSEPQGFCYNDQPVPPPAITGFENASGSAGAQFTIVGENFNQPGLAVMVCGRTAVHAAPTANGTRLLVTAPDCGLAATANVAVEVCTSGGCDEDPAGFQFVVEPNDDVFLRGDSNEDGSVDLSDGVAIFGDLFLGNPARARCRDALDANDSGAVDISDGVWILNFLFQGGPDIRPPFPVAGVDPTNNDTLPACVNP